MADGSAGLAFHEATTVGILGGNTVVEDILETLLRSAGYDARIIDDAAVIGAEDPFVGFDVLLLSPDVDEEHRRTLLYGMHGKSSGLPVLEIPTALKVSVLDDMAIAVAWHVLFEDLVQHIETALALNRAGTAWAHQNAPDRGAEAP